MLIRFLLYLILVQVDCYLLHPSYDIDLEDSAVFRVDGLVKEEDYEMIGAEEGAQFGVENKEKLGMLNKLASKWYETARRDEATRRVKREWFRGTPPELPSITDADDRVATGFASTTPSTHRRHSRQSNSEVMDDYDYDYQAFIKEYYDESIEQSHTNHTFNATEVQDEPSIKHDAKLAVSMDLKTRNCTEEEMKHIGLKALNCIARDYSEGRAQGKVLARRLWRICKIWLAVYVAIAVPLWCTRGWCCCCLYCKFFKPRRTIEAAKLYLMNNPPGVLQNNDGTQTRYAATDYEVDSYEELDHFIRTM